MIQTLVTGVDSFDRDLSAVYTRHDSVDERFLAEHTNTQGLKRIFTYAVERLSPLYLDMLDEFWSQSASSPDAAQAPVTLQRAWTSLQVAAFLHAVEISFLKGDIEARDKDRLTEKLSKAVDEGAYQISLVGPDQVPVLLHSAFVITLEPEVTGELSQENSQGAVCLLTAINGVEKFSSLSDLAEKLRERFANAEEKALLTEDLSLRAAGQFAQVANIDVRYSRCSGYLARTLATAVRARQLDDFGFMLANAQQWDSVSQWLDSINSSQSLAYLDNARHINIRKHMESQQALSTPHWLGRDASESDRASYDVYAAEYRRRAEEASRLLKGLESLEVYALNKIDGYLRQHLGYTVDPRKVFISLQDKWPSPIGDLTPTYRNSLFDFVLDGLPGTTNDGRARIELPTGSHHPALNLEFVRTLVLDLDIRSRYRAEQQARYQSAEVQRALLHQRDSMIALSAWSAKMQAHFWIDSNRAQRDRSLELIWSIRGDVSKPGTTFSMGWLELGFPGNRLRDVIVFREQTRTDEHYVLYVPGAPGGVDMLEFRTWTALYHEVAQWSKTPAGVDYVLRQTPARYRDACLAFMQKVNLKPVLLTREHVIFSPCMDSWFSTNLTTMNNEKINQDMDDDPVVSHLDKPYRHRNQLALVNARIDWLEKAYQGSMGLINYGHFARLAGEEYLIFKLKQRGIDQVIKPDTVYFDLNSHTVSDTPDFGPDTSLVSLTQLIMDDFSYSLSDKTPMYSSIDQDLSSLSRDLVTGVLEQYTGELYINIIKDEYGKKDNEQFAQRQALYAQRQYHLIYRDILLAYLSGQFDDAQFNKMLQHLARLFPGSTNSVNSSINLFRINGNLVEGVFLFKHSTQEDAVNDLIYTPDAPDGIRFRSYNDCAQSLLHENMQRYFYERVSYKRQRVMGTFFEDLARKPEATLKSLLLEGSEKITDLAALHESMIERIIFDVDQQSISAGEELVETVWANVRKVMGIILKPFPPAALAWNLLVALVDFTRGYLAYLDGDRATATDFYISGLSSMISAYTASRKIGPSKGDKDKHGNDLSRLIKWVQKKRHGESVNGLPSHGVTALTSR